MEFAIKQDSEKTEIINIGQQDVLIKMTSFESKIKSLILCYDNHKGHFGSIPIRKTTIKFQAHIKGGDVWFEYKSTDKEYTIELEVIAQTRI